MDVDRRRLSCWAENFNEGRDIDSAYALRVLKSGAHIGNVPALFDLLLHADGFRFLKDQGVDLFQRDASGNTLLMNDYEFLDLETYRFLAEEFARHGAIDWAEEEGITPLSRMIKFGEADYARILLENGASIHTFGTIARYGGRRLDIPTQAVICSRGQTREEKQRKGIAGLKLLKEFGYKPDRAEVERLIDKARSLNRHAIADWLAGNLMPPKA